MKTERNSEIRQLAKDKGVCLYEVAEKLGVSYSTMFNRLRTELSAGQRVKLVSVIDEVAAEHAKVDVTEQF